MSESTISIIILAICVISYVAQAVIINSIEKSTGINLTTGKVLSVLSFLGVVFIAAVAVEGLTLSDLLEESAWMIALIVVSVAAFVFLLVRNVKVAGVGIGIILTILQTIGGVVILTIEACKISLHMVSKQKKAEK